MSYVHTYKSKDNINEFILEDGGIPLNITNVQKMELIFPDFTLDSENFPQVFNWKNGYGRLEICLGNIARVAAGKHLVRLVVYDEMNPEGLDFGKFSLIVHN